MIDLQRLNLWIEQNKISKTELANKLDISQSAVSMICKGKNQVSLKTFARLLQLYPDLNARWLLFGEGDQTYNYKEVSTPSIDHSKYESLMEKHLASKDEIIELLKKQIEILTKTKNS